MPRQSQPSAHPATFLPAVEDYSKYQWFGFAYIQNWVANSILRRSTGVNAASITSMTVPIHMLPQKLDELNMFLYQAMAFFFMVMFIPLIYRTIFRIVSEKQSRVKETMRMMGMGNFAYWASWFTDYTFKNLLISTLVFAIVKTWLL